MVPEPPTSKAERWWGHHFDPWVWYTERIPPWAAFMAPLILLPAPVLLAALVSPDAVPRVWQLELAALIGLQASIPLGISFRLEPWFILACSLWVQFLLLIWIVRNVELLRRWKRFDRFLRRQEEKALQTYDRKPWLRKFHFLGLTLFIFMPLASGLFTGVFIGKLTGMSDRRMAASIFLGTVLWALLFVYVGDFVGDYLSRVIGDQWRDWF